MNKTQAMTALKRLFGKTAMWRYDESAPNAEMREVFKSTLPALMDAKQKAKAALEVRRMELMADPEYVRLKEAADLAAGMFEAASAKTRHYRVTVGKDTGFAFHVVAEGDNWDDAITNARAKTRV